MSKKIRLKVSHQLASGNRKGWAKLVTSVDPSKDNGYAFAGEFLQEREYDFREGDVVVRQTPEGSVKNRWNSGRVCVVRDKAVPSPLPEGKTADDYGPRLYSVGKAYNWETEFLSFRDHVAAVLLKEREKQEAREAVAVCSATTPLVSATPAAEEITASPTVVSASIDYQTTLATIPTEELLVALRARGVSVDHGYIHALKNF